MGPHANGSDRGGGAHDFARSAAGALIVDHGVGVVLLLVPYDFDRIVGAGLLARVAFLLAEGGKADVVIDERLSDDVLVLLLAEPAPSARPVGQTWVQALHVSRQYL